MATLYTPLVDGLPNRAATFNEPLQEMEDAILERAGVMQTRTAWTTLTADTTAIVIDVAAGDNTLQLMMLLRTDRAGVDNDAIRITINDDTGSTYTTRFAQIDSSVTSVGYSATTGFQLDYGATGATATAAYYTLTNMRIALASTPVPRPIQYDSVFSANSSSIKLCAGAGAYGGSAAITRLRIVPVNGTNFVAGCQYALYGLS